MIEKLNEYKITNRDGSFINVECNTKIINTLVRKINNLVDTVNELQMKVNKLALNINFAQPKVKENAQSDYVATAYMTDGHTKKYYGQNGATVVTDNPIPAGYLITIREPEIKGGDNE